MIESKSRKDHAIISKGYILRQPTLRQIQAFKAFVETGTVSKAADLLFISQPAASKLLTHLEEDSGLRLLDRGHGKMNVTERGMRLYEEIDRIFTGIDQISQAIETIRQEDRGHLTIGLMPGIPSNIVASTTKKFVERYPDVYLSFAVRSSQFIVDSVLARNFDFGIVLKPLNHNQFTTDLFDDSPLVAVVPKDHEFSSKSALSLKDLCSTPFVASTKGSALHHVVERMVIKQQLQLNVVLEATLAHTVLAMVSAGLGISVTHPMLVNPAMDGVKIVHLKDRLSLPVLVVRAKNSRRDKMIDEFLSVFNETLDLQ